MSHTPSLSRAPAARASPRASAVSRCRVKICGWTAVSSCVCVGVAIAMCARAFSVSFNPLIYSYPQRKNIYKKEMRAQQGIL